MNTATSFKMSGTGTSSRVPEEVKNRTRYFRIVDGMLEEEYSIDKYCEYYDKLIQSKPKSRSPLLRNWVLIKEFFNIFSKYFDFRNAKEIENYIIRNQHLIPFLKKCYPNIRRYFPNEKLFLEIVNDPSDNEEELILFIKTYLDPTNAIEKLERFDKEWWVKASIQTRNKLVIDVEFDEIRLD